MSLNFIANNFSNNLKVFDRLGSLIEKLDEHGGWQPLRKAIDQQKDFVNWTEDYDNISHLKVSCLEGYGSYSFDNHIVDRGFHNYTKHILKPLIDKQIISDGSKPGSFDDQKLRWSDTKVESIVDICTQELKLSIGPTWYQQCQHDIHRSNVEAIQLMLAGLDSYSDPYAYFARGMGIVAIPITREGTAFIGTRSNTFEYNNYLSFVGGWLSFSSNPNEINVYNDLERELQEEIFYTDSLKPNNSILVGLSGHPFTGETDLVFLVNTNLSDDHFVNGDWPEHKEWFPIGNKIEAEQLLLDGVPRGSKSKFDLMFSSRMGLHFLANNWWQS